MVLQIPVPPGWKEKPILVRIFTMLVPDFERNDVRGRGIMWGRVAIVPNYASFRFQDVIDMGVHMRGSMPTLEPLVEWREAPESAYLLLVTPVDDEAKAEEKAEVRLDEAEAWVIGHWDKNIAHHRVAQIVFEGDQMHSGGAAREGPGDCPVPSLSHENWDLFDEASQAGSSLGASGGGRAAIALRWFKRGCRNRGTDAFVAFWVAMDAAFMEDKIEPVRRLAAAAYQLDPKGVESRTAVGRLYGLRGRIVHEGWDGDVDYHLLRYMQLLFWDLFALQYLSVRWNRALAYFAEHDIATLVDTALANSRTAEPAPTDQGA